MFGLYNVDIAPGSWPTVIDTIQADELPPGLPPAYLARTRNAQRIAVLTAWRYLGPTPKCTHSHLILLDHNTLDAQNDVLPFTLRDGDRSGHNYRLDAKAAGKHKWYYFPDMDANKDLLLFVAYDTDSSFNSKLPFATLFHGAVLGPSDKPTRQSVDVRILLGWD